DGSPPLPLLDHSRVGLFDQAAEPRQRLAPPVAQLLDPRIDQSRGGLAALSFLRPALALLHDRRRSLAGVACTRRQKKYENAQSTPVVTAQPQASGPSPTERWAMTAEPRSMANPA